MHLLTSNFSPSILSKKSLISDNPQTRYSSIHPVYNQNSSIQTCQIILVKNRYFLFQSILAASALQNITTDGSGNQVLLTYSGSQNNMQSFQIG